MPLTLRHGSHAAPPATTSARKLPPFSGAAAVFDTPRRLFPRFTPPAPSRSVSCDAFSSDYEDDFDAADVPDTLPVAGVDADWREFRAKLVASSSGTSSKDDPETSGEVEDPQGDGYWVHEIAKPEPGCLILSHPLMFVTSQTYFSQAVIFLFAHGDQGSAGLILNRPTEFTLGKIAGAENLCPEFEENCLYLGGDVGKRTLHLMHRHGDLDGVEEVVNGVYLGGFEAAKTSVREGVLNAEDFKCYTRYAGWGPGQLEEEIDSGVWFTGAAARDVILKSRNSGEPADMWHEVMGLMGGEYAELSKAVQETYRPDILGKSENLDNDTDS